MKKLFYFLHFTSEYSFKQLGSKRTQIIHFREIVRCVTIWRDWSCIWQIFEYLFFGGGWEICVNKNLNNWNGIQ